MADIAIAPVATFHTIIAHTVDALITRYLVHHASIITIRATCDEHSGLQSNPVPCEQLELIPEDAHEARTRTLATWQLLLDVKIEELQILPHDLEPAGRRSETFE